MTRVKADCQWPGEYVRSGVPPRTLVPMSVSPPTPADTGLFGWWRVAGPQPRKALVAASLGWALDAFDVMLFSLTLAAVIAELGLTKVQAGALGSITLLGGAVGGLVFGHIADRFGRTRAMMASVLLYSVFTAACGLSRTFWDFAVFRALLGLGMGGEWASGAALVSESWPAKHRGRALGFMQSSWAIGFAAAALVVGFVLPRHGWRMVYFIGILPAFFVFWLRRSVQEPDTWIALNRARKEGGALAHKAAVRAGDMFRGPMLRLTASVTFMNACALFGWWALNGWVPAYLSLPVVEGGIGLSTETMSWLIFFMQIGMWFGYITFGYITDVISRKKVYITYLLAASVLLPLYGSMSNATILLFLGPFVAFFGTGFFSGFGAVTAEIYPTGIRATAQGFTYNIGRVVSAAAPFTVGKLATTVGFQIAFAVAGAAYLLAASAWTLIPETRGKELD